MFLTSLFMTSFLVAFSGAMVPGPLLTVTINETMRRGFISGPLLILGHGLLELVLTVAMVWGLNEIMITPGMKTGISLVGGLFLLWMAYGMIRDAGKLEFSLDKTENPAGGRKAAVIMGALVSLANPYFVIWWATVGLTYLTLAMENGLLGLSVFFTGHFLADFAWYTLLAYMLARGKKFISPKAYQMLLTLCGIFLALLSAYFLYSGVISPA